MSLELDTTLPLNYPKPMSNLPSIERNSVSVAKTIEQLMLKTPEDIHSIYKTANNIVDILDTITGKLIVAKDTVFPYNKGNETHSTNLGELSAGFKEFPC